ncbi:nuclease-related domain-containing protein, partial [Halobacillus sp. BBL2006]|uniref:nuclease-related domain-containing protein n=1 Tax=Halobacillus sp. BBL2006 TaxID=1543706 RepID=UPI000541E168
MNNIPRQKTSELLQLETLLQRLSAKHPMYEQVHEQLLRLTAGHFGETAMDFYLMYLPKGYHVVQDVRLFDGIQHFQIDALIITQKFLLILEVKNFKGKLIFYFEHQQLFRLANGVKDIFP